MPPKNLKNKKSESPKKSKSPKPDKPASPKAKKIPIKKEDFKIIKEPSFSLKDNNAFQKMHIVLDLDATLVHSFIQKAAEKNYRDIYNFLDKNKEKNPECVKDITSRIKTFHLSDGNGENSFGWTILRPGIYEFLDFAFRFFRKVSIWTAGTADYAELIVDNIFEAPFPKPEIVYSRDDCVKKHPTIEDIEMYHLDSVIENLKKHKNCNVKLVQCSPSNASTMLHYKPLNLIAKQEQDIGHHKKGKSPSPSKMKDILSDIFLLDDRDDISAYNPTNTIKIPEFGPKITNKDLIKNKDEDLKKLSHFFLNAHIWRDHDKIDIRKVLNKNPKIF